jgi:hypothetical protein
MVLESAIETKAKPWSAKMALHREGKGRRRYAYASD